MFRFNDDIVTHELESGLSFFYRHIIIIFHSLLLLFLLTKIIFVGSSSSFFSFSFLASQRFFLYKMSLTFESPTRGNGANDAYFTPLNMPSIIPQSTSQEDASNSSNSTANTPYYTAPINPSIHQDFLNAIQARHATQPTVLTSPSNERPPPMAGFNLNMGSLANRRQPPTSAIANSSLQPMESIKLNQVLDKYKDTNALLVLDVRSFVQYSHSRIRGSINVSIPNTILKRPTFTLDKVYEAIVLDHARERLRSWEAAECIVFYDQQSQRLLENSASAYLGAKLIRAGFKGQLYYLKGKKIIFCLLHIFLYIFIHSLLLLKRWL